MIILLSTKGKVVEIEYDPNRTVDIALIKYEDGDLRYILCPEGLKVGDVVIADEEAALNPGNAMQLTNIPIGMPVHNIELYPGKGGQIVRTAGASAVILAKEGGYVDVKLPSKEVRKIRDNCYATIGQLNNPEHKLEKIGKAGRRRLMGIRPTVRGVAQSPHSHPHGGGEGRGPEGRHPKTPWGKPARGKKTRKAKWSDKLIVKSKRTK